MKQNQKIVNLAKLFTNKPLLLIKELTLFYSKFKNGDKIIKLLIIWLSQYHFFCITYYKSKYFKKFLISKNSLLFSAEKMTGNKYEVITPKKNNFFCFISLCIASSFKYFVLRGYGYDEQKFLSRYLSFISRFFLRYLPFVIDQVRKKTLVNILSKYLSKKDFKYLDLSLPDIFFSKEIKLLSKKDKHIKTSPHVFWDLDGYEKILLIENKIHIHGFQHGGGYELKKDLIRFYETIMADYYWFWGFGDLNIIQHRYKKAIKNDKKSNKINRILWIERPSIAEIYKFLMPKFFIELHDTKIINFIETELKNYKKKKFRIVYKERLSDLYQNSVIKLISDERKPELIIKKNDLVIFDHINHSLIYFCLCRNISFLCVIDLKKYSNNYDKNYINFLKSRNAIVDCSSKLLKHNLKQLGF